MVEESPESFISRWRHYAAEVEMFAHTEGSPLLECRAGEAVLQLLERTGPYLSRPGPAKVIINPGTNRLEPVSEPDAAPSIESRGLSDIVAVGTVVAREGHIVVIDAGVPLVAYVRDVGAPAPVEGAKVRLASDGPIHGFVLAQQHAPLRRPEAVDEGI